MKVLYIEDDINDIDLLRIKARSIEKDVEIIAAENLREAIAALEESPIDCIVADYSLADTNGLALMDKLREKGIVVPVIFFSGMRDESIASEARMRGADDFLFKDMEGRGLTQLLARLQSVYQKDSDDGLDKNILNDTAILLNATDDLVFSTDTNGTIIYVNAAARRHLDPADHLVTGAQLLDFIEDEYKSIIRNLFTADQSTPASHMNVTLISRTGEPLKVEISWVKVSQKEQVVGYAFFARNLKNRRDETDDIRERLERYEVLATLSSEGLIVHDNGMIMDCSSGFENIIRATREKLLGMNALEFITDDYREQALAHITADREEPYLVEAVRIDGESFFAELRGKTMTHRGRKYRVATVRDVTERVQTKRKLKETLRKLDVLNSLVSQELKTPLWRIDSTTSLLLEALDAGKTAEAEKMARQVFSVAEDMKDFMDDLSAFTHLGDRNIKMEEVDFTSLAEQTLTELISQSNRTIATNVEEGITVYGDRVLLTMLLEKLLDNAIASTAEVEDAEITVRSAGTEEQRVITVSDNGTGFRLEGDEDIFEAFSRLMDRDLPGTGLGLATAERIVQIHGGTIWARNRKGGGAAISFSIVRPSSEESVTR